MSDPGPLLARGRSADVYELGVGRVLRRRRDGPIFEHEVVAMRAAHSHGFPVPEIFDVDGADMVMERVDGVDYLSVVTRRPWQARRVGRMLAELHRRLAAVPVTGLGLRVVGEPAEAIVHGDLHPGNVLASPDGPMVIDWEGAGLGPRDADTATTWLLMSIADIDDAPVLIRPAISRVRRALIGAFAAGVATPSETTVDAVCEIRLGDPNLRPHEKERIRRFRGERQAPNAP